MAFLRVYTNRVNAFFCVASLDSKKYLSHAFESVFDDEDDDGNDGDDVGEGNEKDFKKNGRDA